MFAIVDARVVLESGEVSERTNVLVSRNKIRSVGTSLKVPKSAEVIRARGKWLVPGLIDAHTHLGVAVEGVGPAGADTNDATEPSTPHLRAIDSVNPFDKGFTDALKAGVTTVCVAPGSANVLGGICCVLHTAGKVVEDMVLVERAGMKAAFGENPKRVYSAKGKMPSTRMGIAGVMREQFVKASTYAQKMKGKKKDRPERDLKLEALVEVLTRRMPLRAHAHQVNDICTALRIAGEFGFKLVIEHVTEGHEVADVIARSGVPVIVGPTISSRSKVELDRRSLETPAVLDRAGVTIALMTDHPVMPIYSLPIAAGVAMKHGLGASAAMRAVTINPAKILGIEKRTGSIKRGKDADIVLWSGNPFEVSSRAERVWVEGKELTW